MANTKNALAKFALQNLGIIDLDSEPEAAQLNIALSCIESALSEGRARGFVWWDISLDDDVPAGAFVLFAKICAGECAQTFYAGTPNLNSFLISADDARKKLYLNNPQVIVKN